jgi:hypothetical protein
VKIIITEDQYKKLLRESPEGIEELFSVLFKKHPNLEQHKQVIEDFINNSGCKKIEIKSFKIQAAGLALHDKVVYNPYIFNISINYLIYIIFHEIAHQYQYKKYGMEKMYALYNGQLQIDEAVKWLRYTETVADEFAIRKCRELKKLGVLNGTLVTSGMYGSVPDMHLKSLLVKFRNLIRSKKITDPIAVSEILYNHIIAAMQEPEKGDRITDQPIEVDERARTFANTRKMRLFPLSAMKANPDRFKFYDKEKKGIEEQKPLTDKQVKSIEDLNKDAKFLKCHNCKKKFTQTAHKGKKSLPICPWCGTHNQE